MKFNGLAKSKSWYSHVVTTVLKWDPICWYRYNYSICVWNIWFSFLKHNDVSLFLVVYTCDLQILKDEKTSNLLSKQSS